MNVSYPGPLFEERGTQCTQEQLPLTVEGGCFPPGRRLSDGSHAIRRRLEAHHINLLKRLVSRERIEVMNFPSVDACMQSTASIYYNDLLSILESYK